MDLIAGTRKRLTNRRATSLFLAGVLAASVLMFHGTALASKIDPRIRSLTTRIEEGRAIGMTAEALCNMCSVIYPGVQVLSDNHRIAVDCLMLLDAEGEAELRDLGIEPRNRVGDIVTITVPLDAMSHIETIPGVGYVEMTRRLKPFLDVSRPATGANSVHGASAPPFPTSGYTGRGVVVGVIDTGIDLTHDDFKDAEGNTRIDFVWDQSQQVGTRPQPFNYGTEWTAAQIDAGTATQVDTDGHGTHVAGIAAGDGSAGSPGNQYIGIAPESDIIYVKTTFLTDRVTDAVSYIIARAGERDAVINLSLGTQDGPHDGTSLFDQGIGSLPSAGRIIVAAAGNEGNPGNNSSVQNVHARLTFEEGVDSLVFSIDIPPYNTTAGNNPLNDFLVIDGWYDGDDNMSFRVESPTGKRSAEVFGSAVSHGCLPGGNSEGRVYIENNMPPGPNPANGDREIYIEITENAQGQNCGFPRSGEWKIIAYRSGAVKVGHVDFWVAAAFLGQSLPSWDQGAANSHLVGSPASAPNVISVGAYITKTSWQAQAGARQYVGVPPSAIGEAAAFSSPGPLRDGTLAPDISAPGQGIGAARSAQAANNSNFTLTDGVHVINQGTSQATPHVTGAIALILERYPHETPQQILNRLTLTADRDADTGDDPNSLYGHGKLDVIEAMDFDTPIYLSLLEAVPDGDAVRLRWKTEGDDPFIGFHVSRAPGADGPFARLTESLVSGGPDFEYRDANVTPGREYWYLLESVDLEGRIERFGPLLARAGAPRLQLAQNGPNPFAQATVIQFGLPAPGPVSLQIFDLNGQLIKTLLSDVRPAGTSQVSWDGSNDAGQSISNGVYFYRLSTQYGSETRKMILKRP